MNYVIIGNGPAAIAAVEAIRPLDASGNITLVSKEDKSAYSRPLISYYLMGAAKSIDYRPRDFYKTQHVTAKLGVAAQKIDRASKKVILENGEELPYDKLLIATGSNPFTPPFSGLDGVKEKFTFMSAADMEGLEKVLSKDKKVLIVGAGLIGLKCAEGILDRVASVTVVDMADRVLPSVLDAAGASLIQRQLEALGIKFLLSDGVEGFSADTASLKSGKKVNFDILVLAVGVRPNTSLFKEAGGNVNRGIVVDSHMRTSDPSIYAAGDCAEGYDMSKGANAVLALLPNAVLQGRCAGENMAGKDSVFDCGIPMNAIGFFGSHVLSAGVYEGEAIVDELTQNTYRKLFVKDNKLAGFILINDFARAGIYTSLIRGGVKLDGVDMQLLKHSPQILAFSKSQRAQKLSREV